MSSLSAAPETLYLFLYAALYAALSNAKRLSSIGRSKMSSFRYFKVSGLGKFPLNLQESQNDNFNGNPETFSKSSHL